ncbi:hypothetical protein KGP36_06445 [Patescibacteria group bacterium]|nr:hypothetical protein [Patescibacteria group bacterium]
MASLKGGQVLYDGSSVADTAKSTLAYIGPGPYVAVYIDNTSAVNMTFKVQVTGTPTPMAGMNALDGTADGGLTWYDYTGSGGVGAETSITVNAGITQAFDLSPFAPEFIRLVRTDSNGPGTVAAFVTSSGPN